MKKGYNTQMKHSSILPTWNFRCLLTVFAVVGGCITTHAQTWNLVGIGGFSAGKVGYTSIAMDGSGTPYVVFSDNAYNNKATVMKFNGSTWETVGTPGFSLGGGVIFTSIAINASGTPYIVYEYGNIFSSNGVVVVMKFNGSNWVAVDSAGLSANQASSPTIAIDNSGTLYVAYQDYATITSGATVKKYNGSSWVTVGSAGFSPAGGAYSVSIAIDGTGTPYVAYGYGQYSSVTNDGGEACVMKYNGSSWVYVGSARFSANQAVFTRIAIDNSGTPYVAYLDWQYGNLGGGNHPVMVMKYNGSSWVNVGNAGFSDGGLLYSSSAGNASSTSLAIDGSGTPYVVFSDDYVGKEKAMKFDGSSWVGAGNDSEFSALISNYATIAIDLSGIPYVVYEDGGSSQKATVRKLNTISRVKTLNNSSVSILKIFPNPTRGSFIINIASDIAENAQIIVTNTIGQKVKEMVTTTNKETEIHLNVPSGIYSVSAITNKQNVTAKIIIE